MGSSGSKRKTKEPEVPSIDADPAERKRILNVIAQRRYRRRRKEHIRNLERTILAGDDRADTTVSTSEIITPSPFQLTRIDHDSTLFDASAIDFACFDPNTLAAVDACFTFPLPLLPPSPAPSIPSDIIEHTQPLSDDVLSFSGDEVHLPVLELNLLRGAMTVAKSLQVDSIIWSLDATSPFYGSAVSPSSFSHLPINLRPTSTQRHYPHHPVLDILPWPSVRDKLILVFAQPIDLRPPNARTPTALLDLAYDMEDSSEGIRISGSDPFASDNWEVGEKMFRNWWWSMNSDVVARANVLRQERGARMLSFERNIEEVV